ncbi:MAG: glutamate--tRNA ligase [Clostridia bacterium]|jgi:glutamyl-tRNA synthetase
MFTEVRTRFAPSPTGYIHIGNFRTALYGYLFAKKHNGKFILRIEDTDQERYVEGAIEGIYKTLAMAGLKYDEGPDIGGDYGPYIQSQRKEIYKKYAKKLVELGGAYYCFCSKERLESLRSQHGGTEGAFKYDKHCLHLSKEEVEEKLRQGIRYVIRQNIPETGTTSFEDMVYGTITAENSTLDDNVLLKSDGMPTYNFANVVDDHLMKISHVIRGSEYLSSTPKYNLIYQAFGWEIPTYIHLPVVMKSATKKLSKREGDASFEDFIARGFLKDAIVNYVALLGWSPGTNEEFFTLEELEERFSLEGLNKSPAIFDIAKLTWMNGQYIRRLSVEEFHEMALPYYQKVLPEGVFDLKLISRLLHTRTEVLEQIPEMIDFLQEMPDYDLDLYTHKKMKTNPELALKHLKEALPVLEKLEDWEEETVHAALTDLVKKLGVKNGQILWPVRVAISGKAFTPGGAIELAVLLGKEETLRRMNRSIEKLEKVLR